MSHLESRLPPAAEEPSSNVTPAPPHPAPKASATSAHIHPSVGPSNISGPVTLYSPLLHTNASPSPPLRISTRRLQVFSYVLAELSSAATLLPDYTRAILNLSRRLIGAWQAITAAAIARTRYEHALVWAAYRQQQQQQFPSRRTLSPAHVSSTTSHEKSASAATDRRGAAKRRGTSCSFPNSAAATTTMTTASSAASRFHTAASPSASHKRRRLGWEEAGDGSFGCGCGGLRSARQVSAQRLRNTSNNKNEAVTQPTGEKGDDVKGVESLPVRISSAPAAPPRKTGQTTKSSHGRHNSTSPRSLPFSGAAERRARQLALRYREQLFLSTLQQLWLDAQEKEDKAGQHVEYLRGLILNAIFQQYLGIAAEQSYHDLVLYCWLTPVLVSVRDSTMYGMEKRDKEVRTSRWTRDAFAEEAAHSRREDRRPFNNFFSSSSFPYSPLAGELEHGGGGAVRRARRRQAAVQVAQDIVLLRQMLQRVQITVGPSMEHKIPHGKTKRRRKHMREAMGESSHSTASSLQLTTAAPTSSRSKKRRRLPSILLPTQPQPGPTKGEEEVELAGSPSSSVHDKTTSTPPSTNAANHVKAQNDATDASSHYSNEEGSNSLLDTVSQTSNDEKTIEKEIDKKNPSFSHTSQREEEAEEEDEEESTFYATLHHSTHPRKLSPLSPQSLIAVPLPLALFLQACTSFDPTHCAFSLMSRCVILAQHVRGEDEKAKPANMAAACSNSKSTLLGEEPSPKDAVPEESRERLTEDEEVQGRGESGEELAGLFYVVIARRTVGACAHTALCFGNHKFIFVRCRDTEALIREVMLSDEDEEKGEVDERLERETDATAQGSRRECAESMTETRVSEAVCTTKSFDQQNAKKDAPEDYHTDTSLDMDLQEKEEQRQMDERSVGELAAQNDLHTPTYLAVSLKSRTQEKTTPEAEQLSQGSPLPFPLFPALRSQAGITALTEQDAQRLERNSSIDSATLRGQEQGDDFQNTAYQEGGDGVGQLPRMWTSAGANMLPCASTHPHVVPALHPLVSDTATAANNSTAFSSVSSAAAAVAARRWGRHMRQAARPGPRTTPPPFVSTDAMELQVNPGFLERMLQPQSPAPPMQALRASTITQTSTTTSPDQASPLYVPLSLSAQAKREVRHSHDSTTSLTAMGGNFMPTILSTAPRRTRADTVEAQLNVSVHSPVHLTPLAFHTRLHPTSGERSRVMAPLELSTQTPPLSAAVSMTPKQKTEVSSSITAFTATATHVSGEDGANEEASPVHSSRDATAFLSPTRGLSSLDSARTADQNEQRYSNTLTNEVYAEAEEASEEKRNAARVVETAAEEEEGSSRICSNHQHNNEDGEDYDDTEQQYVVMHSAMCSCARGTSEADNNSNNINLHRRAQEKEPESTHGSCFKTQPSHPHMDFFPVIPNPTPRESAFPSARTAGTLGGQSSMGDDFPLSYFDQQVLLPPGSGQERQSSGHHRRSSRLRLDSVLHAIQSPSALAATASHLSYMPDPLRATSFHTPKEAAPDARGNNDEKESSVVAQTTTSAEHDTEACRKEEERGVQQQQNETAFPFPAANTAPAAEEREEEQRHSSASAETKNSPHKEVDKTSPRLRAFSALPFPSLLQAVEPTEGDMAFAAELYSRLEFWSLRGQDRSAYIDPSWRRADAHNAEPKNLSRTSTTTAKDGVEGMEANFSSKPQTHEEIERKGVEDAHLPLSSPSPAKDQNSSTAVSTDSDDDDDKGEGDTTPLGMVRLPLKLLDYAAGVIELVDEAYLAKQRRRRATRAKRRRNDKSPLEAEKDSIAVDEVHAECEEGEEDGGKGYGRGLNSELSDNVSAEDDQSLEDKDHGSFPYLTPLMTVNARGKELLFEALHEATEVVVCAVRESRAHTGYHDLLHQRCPPPLSPSSSPSSAVQSPFTTHKNVSSSNGSQIGSPKTQSGALMPLNAWAVTASAAAAQGCSFPVNTGTLSHNERCPFTFDRHQHLGTYGTVRWSQGDAAVADKEGINANGSGAAADVSESSLSLLDSKARSLQSARGRGIATATPPNRTCATHSQTHPDRKTPLRHDTGRSSGNAVPPLFSPSFPATTPTHAWRWPALPVNDEKQWRCELLKSEFRLARSRCLDALLVDSVHGRPVAAITLEPRTWTQMQDDTSNPAHSPSQAIVPDNKTAEPCSINDHERATKELKDSESKSSILFPLLTSAQEVVQRTVYVVTSFTHYVAPLWRHLNEEKAILVDMDRTLVDNVITMRTVAERQRHLVHLNRAVAAAEGRPGTSNPCVLWHVQQHRPAAARFVAPPFRFGQNDAMPLSEDEVLWSEKSGASSRGDHDVSAPWERSNRSTGGRRASSLSAPHVMRPSCTGQDAHTTQTDSNNTNERERKGEGLLHAFLHRTATQREALGTLHYEECGAVIYAAGALYSTTERSEASKHGSTINDVSVGSGSHSGNRGSTSFSTSFRANAADRSAGVYSDLVYVRPGVRQFLYRTAVQWNIPIVLVTKSTRSRTEAILRNVLDPHKILFPDLQTCLITADEMLCDLASLEGNQGINDALLNKDQHKGITTPQERAEEDVKETQKPLHKPRDTLNTNSTSMATAERIAHCHKSTIRVLQSTLDSAALDSAQHAWRAPPWCDLFSRLPKPRSVAVLDDAPQVWERRDWPCTVNIAPYTLSRVDPLSYFSPHGFMSALVLSCLYGSKCLVCSAGELRVGAATTTSHTSFWQSTQQTPPGGREKEQDTASCSPHTESPLNGAERWPHCICVCPPDHQDEISRAEEGLLQGDQCAFYANDAALSVKAIITGLMWRSLPHGAVLLRLRALLLPTTGAANTPTMAVEERPGLRSATSAATVRNFGSGTNDDTRRTDGSMHECFHSPKRQINSSNINTYAGGKDASFVEDVKPLAPLKQESALGLAASSTSSVERLERTLRPKTTNKARSSWTKTATSRSPHPATAPPEKRHSQKKRSGKKVVKSEKHHEKEYLPSSLATDSSSSPTGSASSTSSSSLQLSSSSFNSAASSLMGGDASRELSNSPYSLPSAPVGASMPATPTSFSTLPDEWSHADSSADPSTPVAAAHSATTRGMINTPAEEMCSAGELGGTYFTPDSKSVGGFGGGGDAGTENYEEVEPVSLAEHRSGGPEEGQHAIESRYAPTTSTTIAPWHTTRSNSSNTDVEDVIPLEMQPAPSPLSSSASSNNMAPFDPLLNSDRGVVTSGPPLQPEAIFTAASTLVPSVHQGTTKTTAAGPTNTTGSSLTSYTAAHVEVNVSQPSSTKEACVGELRRPQRRRVDDPQDKVEDVVPL